MTTNSNSTIPAKEKSTGFKVALCVFLVALAVAIYLLGQSMVDNRFFRGGHMDRNGHMAR